MNKPRLLDTFCKAGGAGMGYHQAGFEVVGVDIELQPRYPFEFHQADAIEYIARHGHEFDVIHASPPCQVHSALKSMANKKHKDWIPQTRKVLKECERTYIIENVPGAPLENYIKLCGTSFGLKTPDGQYSIRRHRLFETNIRIFFTPQCIHIGKTVGIYGGKFRDSAIEHEHYKKEKATRGKPPSNLIISRDNAGFAMGINWMTAKELSQAIPPAYTKWIGEQIISMI